MRIPCAKPVFFWLALSQQRQLDLISGKFRIFAHFDIPKFLGIVSELGIKTSWVTEAKEKVRKISQRIPGSPNAYAVKFELPSGAVQIMNGFFSRVFLYLTKPSSLLLMIKHMGDQQERMAKLHFPEI